MLSKIEIVDDSRNAYSISSTSYDYTSVRLIVNLNLFSTTKTTKTTKGLILFCGLSGLCG
jgi:hypothetical protein